MLVIRVYFPTPSPPRAGVEPPYSDDDTRQFVRTQKEQQFHDLRHALQVMGRIPGYSPDSTSSSPDSSSSPEDFVLIFLLENNKLPSGFPGEMRRMEGQVSDTERTSELCTLTWIVYIAS